MAEYGVDKSNVGLVVEIEKTIPLLVKSPTQLSEQHKCLVVEENVS